MLANIYLLAILLCKYFILFYDYCLFFLSVSFSLPHTHTLVWSRARSQNFITKLSLTTKALSAKHRSHRHHAHDTEMTEAEPSRTPEDSVCSVEGPTETGGEPSAFSTSKSGIYN